MKTLLDEIKILKTSAIKSEINDKLQSFKLKRERSDKEIFSELCYCILTANCSAESCLSIQHTLHNDFQEGQSNIIAQKLRSQGYRFPNTRALYISLAATYKSELKNILTQKTSKEKRDWLVEHIKGIGYKEASHFLRNIGYMQYAILDRHILKILTEFGVINYPKTLTKKTYSFIEKKLNDIAEKTNLSLGALDLYLWYMKTGKILK